MVNALRERVDHSLRSPRYIQVYAAVRDWICLGTYKPGQRLPTEGELCDLFGVSRITTRKAVDMLVDEELVVRQPGRGTFVVQDLADAPVVGDMEQLLRKVERLGKNTRIAQAQVQEQDADAETRKDLRLADGARVQRASHVRLLNKEPIGYVVTYVPADLKVRFNLNELNESPMLTLLERKGVDMPHATRSCGDAGRRPAGGTPWRYRGRTAGTHPADGLRPPAPARRVSPGTGPITISTTST